MWVRSVLPLVPPCQRSAPGVESKATTLAAASSLLISLHQKSFTSLHPGILTMRNPCLLRSTLPRPASESRTWVDGGWHSSRSSSSAILLIGRLCSGQFDKSSWARGDGNAIRRRERHRLPSSPLPRALALAPEDRQLYGFGLSVSSRWQKMAPLKVCSNTNWNWTSMWPAAPSASSEMAEHNHTPQRSRPFGPR